jgi:hypothetical protein
MKGTTRGVVTARDDDIVKSCRFKVASVVVVEAVIAVEVVRKATGRELWLTRPPEQIDNCFRLQVVQPHDEVTNPARYWSCSTQLLVA